jgi:hypothetical protein
MFLVVQEVIGVVRDAITQEDTRENLHNLLAILECTTPAAKEAGVVHSI